MIGRTPEYLGKKISTRDMQFALFALLVSPALILVFAGVSSMLKIALDSLGVGGPHGLSEIVYAYASSAADNGSSFAGLNANTLWYNITTGVAMFFGRFAHAIPILAIAGSLAAKTKAKPSAERLYELMSVYRHMTITAGIVTVCYGAASRYLGMLAATLGEFDKAEAHFEHALEMNQRTGARPWLAHTKAQYSLLLRRRGGRGDSERAETLANDAWKIAAELDMVPLKRRLQPRIQ
jgi:tetratricopeptide (TPR) repeat protein